VKLKYRNNEGGFSSSSWLLGDRSADTEIVSMTELASRLSNRVQLTSDGHKAIWRLTNAFSKDAENHAHSVAIHFMFYNFARIHQTLRVSPAMAAGATGKLWKLGDIVAMIDAAAPPPAQRGPYKTAGRLAELHEKFIISATKLQLHRCGMVRYRDTCSDNERGRTMAARKQFLNTKPVDPELAKLLQAARETKVTEDELHEQRISFA
jgi:hypothetical protein